MRNLRTLVAAALVIAAAPLLGAANPAAVRATATPTDTLDAAVASLKGQSYDVSGTSGSTASGGTGQLDATGSVTPTAGSLEFKGTEGGVPVQLDFVQVGDSFFAKFDLGSEQSQLGVGPDQWMMIDESKITNPNNMPFDLSGSTDALDIAGLLTSVAGVKYPNPSDPTHITGTVDLSAATGVGSPDPTDVASAGAAAKTTPFTAAVDSRGRLTDLKVDADGFDGNLSEEIMLSDFGSPDPVTTPPPSSVIAAPESAYAFFNN